MLLILRIRFHPPFGVGRRPPEFMVGFSEPLNPSLTHDATGVSTVEQNLWTPAPAEGGRRLSRNF